MSGPPELQLRRLFARGGMADLFEGVLDARRVLVKTVRADVNEVEARAMAAALKDEVEGLSRVSHPGIPPVLRVWFDKWKPFILFDFVDGIDISRVEAGGHSVPDPVLVEVADQVLEILEAVHRPGLVHRDISPENILLGGDGRVRLVDFGLSADVQGTTGDLGPRKGKKRYAAPEQWRGQAPDPRADFYALARSLRSVRGGERSLRFGWWLVRGSMRWPGLRPRDAESWRRGLTGLERRSLGSWLKSCYPAGFEALECSRP
ncbi:MAG: serine/threonine-protein kinase [Myxococcota bacterium]